MQWDVSSDGHPIKLLVGIPESASLSLPAIRQREGGLRIYLPGLILIYDCKFGVHLTTITSSMTWLLCDILGVGLSNVNRSSLGPRQPFKL